MLLFRRIVGHGRQIGKGTAKLYGAERLSSLSRRGRWMGQ